MVNADELKRSVILNVLTSIGALSRFLPSKTLAFSADREHLNSPTLVVLKAFQAISSIQIILIDCLSNVFGHIC